MKEKCKVKSQNSLIINIIKISHETGGDVRGDAETLNTALK